MVAIRQGHRWSGSAADNADLGSQGVCGDGTHDGERGGSQSHSRCALDAERHTEQDAYDGGQTEGTWRWTSRKGLGLTRDQLDARCAQPLAQI